MAATALLVERLPVESRVNISCSELQSLIDLGLLTPAEGKHHRASKDGFNKFF